VLSGLTDPRSLVGEALPYVARFAPPVLNVGRVRGYVARLRMLDVARGP
jgi:hypothetical protein